MEKKCESCGVEEVSEERDVCEGCVNKVLEEGSKVGSFKGEYKNE